MNKIEWLSIVAVGIVCFSIGWFIKPIPQMPDYWADIVARANYRAEEGEHWEKYYKDLYLELDRESVSREKFEKMEKRADWFRMQRDGLVRDLEIITNKLTNNK